MTDKERQEFVKQVKGRKIRKNYWNKDSYAIPDGTYKGGYFYGTNYTGNKIGWWIFEGFNKDKEGDYWEFCNLFEEYLHEVLND